MHVRTLARRRPLPTVATAAFLVALGVTAAYFGGLVPGVPKTLSTFSVLVEVTVGTFFVAVLAWLVSLVVLE